MTQWSTKLSGTKYDAKPQRARAGILRWRSKAQLSTAKCRHVPTMRSVDERPSSIGRSSRVWSNRMMSLAARTDFSSCRSCGMPNPVARSGRTTSPCTTAQTSSGVEGNPASRGLRSSAMVVSPAATSYPMCSFIFTGCLVRAGSGRTPRHTPARSIFWTRRRASVGLGECGDRVVGRRRCSKVTPPHPSVVPFEWARVALEEVHAEFGFETVG